MVNEAMQKDVRSQMPNGFSAEIYPCAREIASVQKSGDDENLYETYKSVQKHTETHSKPLFSDDPI